MREFAKPELRPLSDAVKEWRVYHGNSMLRVFSPGDIMLVEQITAKNAAPGDIICFTDSNGKNIVHRFIRWSDDGGLITMGDNNATPDIGIIAPECMVYRVTERHTLSGKIIPVSAGRKGLLTFRINRFRKFARRLMTIAAGILRRINFLKIPVKNFSHFGDEKIFFFLGHPVAKCSDDKNIIWLSPWFRAVLKIKTPEK